MQRGTWLSYGELAWTEPIIAAPDDYADEALFYVNLIREHSSLEPATLLHLGCGAGGHAPLEDLRSSHAHSVRTPLSPPPHCDSHHGPLHGFFPH